MRKSLLYPARSVFDRELRVHVFLDLDPDRSRPEFFSLIFGIFCVHDQIEDQDFSYLLVALRKKVNIKLFFVVFCYIVLLRFEAKYKPGLKLNLDIDPDPTGFESGRTRNSLLSELLNRPVRRENLDKTLSEIALMKAIHL